MNRRRRKLAFIRERNAVRRGMKCAAFFKVSTKMLKDDAFIKVVAADFVFKEMARLNKRLRVNYNYRIIGALAAFDGDDFLFNRKTIRVEFVRDIPGTKHLT